MLKQRIITGLILAPLALIGVFYLPAEQFSWFIGAIIMLGAWEWSNLSGYQAQWQRVLYALCVGSALILLNGEAVQWILWLAAGWWLVALMLVLSYPGSTGFWRQGPLKLMLGFVILIPAWIGLVQMKQYDDSWILISFVLFLVWGADVGAYFFGKYLGSHKLAPQVSPKKTWEGVAGGLLTVSIVAYFAFPYLPFATLGQLMLVSLLVAMVSVLGDLVESMFKRECGIKDSSQLLPGHGGILDRIDSLTAAVPVFALALVLVG